VGNTEHYVMNGGLCWVLEMHEWSARKRGKIFPEEMPAKGEK
jgi:hypothetical protein